MQRGSGGEPLTVARHVDDLNELIKERCEGERPALVGHSWGAMLALAYAAAHPRRVMAVVMISSGTFDHAARTRMTSIQAERIDDDARRRLEHLREQFPNDRLRTQGKLIQELDSYEPIPTDAEFGVVDKRAYQETWQDMMQLQEQGVYPSAFASIREPVIMLHGDYDSHPGGTI